MTATGKSWRVIGLHHVAFAHGGGDIPGRLREVLGLDCAHGEAGPGFLERMLPVGDTGDCFLQLLEPTGPGTVERFLGRRGPGLHHVAFEVTSLEEAIADLNARGIRLVDQASRAGGMGTSIAFVHPAAIPGLLVELVEPPRTDPLGFGVS
jgi:methylmalonyl-CoA/ethylmalonyl-CoA epimerase